MNWFIPALVNSGARGCCGIRLAEGTTSWPRAAKNPVKAARSWSASIRESLPAPPDTRPASPDRVRAGRPRAPDRVRPCRGGAESSSRSLPRARPRVRSRSSRPASTAEAHPVAQPAHRRRGPRPPRSGGRSRSAACWSRRRTRCSAHRVPPTPRATPAASQSGRRIIDRRPDPLAAPAAGAPGGTGRAQPPQATGRAGPQGQHLHHRVGERPLGQPGGRRRRWR